MAISGILCRSGLLMAGALFSLMIVATDSYAGCNSNPAPGVDWSNCRKRNLILSNTDLTGANMQDSEVISTDLRDSKLDDANFVKADLLRTVFDGASLTGADFSKSAGYRTSFALADLSGADFQKSEMQRADFAHATLRNVNFSKASLGRANLEGAVIENSTFEFSILARADFRSAKTSGKIDFTNAFVYLARFEGVDLSMATGMEQAQVDMACGDADTVLPEGLVPGASWPCTDND
jgi:uncharacterized protein YjbI with pentapeptide repeats